MDYQQILDDIYLQVQSLAGVGRQADYIPALAQVDPEQMGMCLETLDGDLFAVGDAQVRFSIQSISKVFALAMALSMEGENLWQRMGREPSGSTFNSMVLLEVEHGKPRNPFINAGAIVMSDILLEPTTPSWPRASAPRAT